MVFKSRSFLGMVNCILMNTCLYLPANYFLLSMRKKVFHVLVLAGLALVFLGMGRRGSDEASNIESFLKSIPGAKVEKLMPDEYGHAGYEVLIPQPVDHNRPNGKKFYQRFVVRHAGFDRPVVVVLEGYQIWSDRPYELSMMLDANQITIEHRFFGKSAPDKIPWEYLSIWQAANDHHAIIQTLKKVYRGKWVSTGISKGGQTTLFHRRFFPDDVDVSVPYVAPLNFAREDPRLDHFLDTMGSPQCRAGIRAFQRAVLSRKAQMASLLSEVAAEKNWSFSVGIERAVELAALEYPFAFWQWGMIKCNEIPDSTASDSLLFAHLMRSDAVSMFTDEDIKRYQPFYYQAMTELGMYHYRIAPFREFLKDTADITFHFMLPKGVKVSYHPEAMQDINNWLQENGRQMLFIYGQYDTWGATGVQLRCHSGAYKFVCPGGSHRTRIMSFEPAMRDSIFHVLGRWLQMEVPVEKFRSNIRLKQAS